MSFQRVMDYYITAISDWMYWTLGLLAVTTVFAVVWRWWASSNPPAVTDGLSATELAYLRSDAAPVVTALAALRARGRITADGRVDRRIAPGPSADWLTERVLQRVEENPGCTVRALVDATRGDLPVLESRLCERGLMRPHAERVRIRLGVIPLATVVLLAGVGCLYVFFRMRHPEPVGAVLLLSLVLCPYAVVVLPALFRVDRRTRAGRRHLKVQQQQQSYLRPSRGPAFATYGPGAVAASTALFGTGALWSVDPDFATSVELNGDAEGGGDGGGDGAACGGCGGGGGGGGCGGCGGGGGGGGGE